MERRKRVQLTVTLSPINADFLEKIRPMHGSTSAAVDAALNIYRALLLLEERLPISILEELKRLREE